MPQVEDAEGGCRLNSSQSACDRSPCTIDRDGKFYATSQTRSVSYEFRLNGLLQGTPQKLDYGRGNAEVLLEEGKAITCSEAGTELELVFTSEDSQGNAISKSWVWSCSACAFVAGTD